MMPRPTAALLAAALSALVWTPSALAQNAPQAPPPEVEAEPTMTAEQVLAKMASAYQDCKTYQDEGEVEIKFDTQQGKWTDRRPFKTAFVRPGKFIYEFTSSVGPGATGPSTRYVVWADGDDIRSWWALQPEVEHHDSILMALAGPTGVSGGSALTVPAMLYGIPGVTRFIQLAQPKLLGEEVVDGAACLKVEGKDRDGESVTLWVEQGTFLIRKIYEEHDFKDFTTRRTTTYKPKVGGDIPDATFSFTPPPGNTK